jgi:CHAT domain-containing protein
VWVATTNHLITRELPGRAVIERDARQLYRAWSTGNASAEAEVVRRGRVLSRLLLGPVADQIDRDRKRLAIVAEGALQFIPFAALPLPGDSGGAPLVSRHEVVMLPSATTLAVLRQESSGRGSPERRVAVLADPVFDRSDSRVWTRGRAARDEPAFAKSDSLVRSMHDSGLQRLERLTGTRREAEQIAALAGRRSSLEALDFQASRSTALGPEVASARIIHFASHGLLNARHPELSGIVLSLVNKQGRPIDGFLQTRDVYKMRLSADLVVLSACQTALGKDVRGEGLLGLSRGFMYAGVPKIVASLWRVPDRATAELMKCFYRGILVEGLRPAAALRAAQNTLRRQRLWSSPYSWAAFTLQGDWD